MFRKSRRPKYKSSLAGIIYVNLCKKYNFFTHGDIEQYKDVIEMVRDCLKVHDIALCTWICSSPELQEKYSVKDIEILLRNTGIGYNIKDWY